MIVELFGLPASGKSTVARAWEGEGATLVRPPGKGALILLNLAFVVLHPLRSFTFLKAILLRAEPAAWRLLFMNTFMVHNAKYLIAKQISRKGGIAILDQGHFQNSLSVFREPPPEHVLRAYVAALPRPDLLVVLDVSKEERATRLDARGNVPRTEFGAASAATAAATAEADFPRVMRLVASLGMSYRMLSGASMPTLTALLAEHLSYITLARMPTEKAHGVSIAAMCSSFAARKVDTALVVPNRVNLIVENLYSYYGVPERFLLKRVAAPDFVGRGLTATPFFFLQRALFMLALLRARPPAGIVYTREPEVAWLFSDSRIAVYEAHRMPEGFAGWLTARLVRNVRLVVCNSRGTESAFKARGIMQTIVAPNGFDPSRFASAVRSREELALPAGFLALYAGSEEKWKGAHIFRAAKPFAPGAAFAVMGSTKPGIHDGIVDLGRMRQGATGEYLRSADVLVLPNTKDTEESVRFTSPIKLFEYLGAGKAIVASDLPSIREILTDEDALFVPPGDAEALGKAIERLRNDAPLRERLAARAKALSASYTWDARAARILDALA